MPPTSKPQHPTEPLSYQAAITYTKVWLERHLLTGDEHAGWTCSVFDYFDGDETRLRERPWLGVRISEIGVSGPTATGSAGASWMQGELPWGLAFCAQAERCILALIECWNDAEVDADHIIQGTDEEFDNFALLIEESNE